MPYVSFHALIIRIATDHLNIVCDEILSKILHVANGSPPEKFNTDIAVVLFDDPGTNTTTETIYEEYINRRAIIIITTPFNKSLPDKFLRLGISKFSFEIAVIQLILSSR